MSRSQFSLRTLLAAVAAIGIGAALWTAKPSWPLGLVEVLVSAWVPASAIILAINSTGRAKAWWIGVAAECTFTAFVCNLGVLSTFLKSPGQGFQDLFEFPFSYAQYVLLRLAFSNRLVLTSWAFAPIVGLLCVLTHWLLVRKADPKD